MQIAIKSGGRTAYIEVEKEGTYILIGLGFSLYSLAKQTRQKEEKKGKLLSYKQEKK